MSAYFSLNQFAQRTQNVQELSYSILQRDVQKVLFFVLGCHLLAFIIGTFGTPDFKFNKRPDITIEIGAAPPVSSGSANQGKLTPSPTQRETPKEKTPPPS